MSGSNIFGDVPAQDFLLSNKDDDWGNALLSVKDKTTLGVVLTDRLMTDAALRGPRPIKSEHSYSLSAYSPPASPATPGDNPHTPNSGSMSMRNSEIIDGVISHKTLGLRTKIDDMEEECFPAISMDTLSGRDENSAVSVPESLQSSPEIKIKQECIDITDEPICPLKSRQSLLSTSSIRLNFIDDQNSIRMVSPHRLHFKVDEKSNENSDSEEDDEEDYQNMEFEECDTHHSGRNDGGQLRQGLPPTPPSSAGSDSEGAASVSCSPERRDSRNLTHQQNIRGLLGPRLYVTNGGHSHITRQPIHTSLISTQPKGSTGMLILTEEEKRTLIAEGYPVPTKLPLTKQEEKSLKKVRRKIKNKISAQESRRKKKEYMDGLERRVTMLTNENSSYRDRLSTLEDTNRELLKELQRLQALVDLQTS
ncbi:hypothetical protein PV325_006133 [Microctonus aethiopoides]|nr:hypothetical protein PV325_006133 [Microctonus aethiopoides]